MRKEAGVSLIIILSTLFIVLFVYLTTGDRKRDTIPQNILSSDLSGNIDLKNRTAFWHGENIAIPESVFGIDDSRVLSAVSKNERWIEVDLSDQKLTAWEDGKVFLESLVSTGLPWWPTPQGEFTVWLKVRATLMEGGEGRYYYYLPNVPYVMFFENEDLPRYKGFGIHGTYWHNDFGAVHSHGCVNLPTDVAKELYYWTYPILSNGQGSVYASEDNPGTKIVIHE